MTPRPAPASEPRLSFRQLLLPFWTDRRHWQTWLMVVAFFSLLPLASYLSVQNNQLIGVVTDALVNRQWPELWHALLLTGGFGLAVVALFAVRDALRSLVDLQWRTWMTQHFLTQWTGGSAYYDLEREGQLTNTDQRIAEDVQTFVHQTVSMLFNLSSAVVNAVTYGVLLWTLSGALDLSWSGLALSVPGYMLWAALLYMALDVSLIHLVGRTMTRLTNEKQTVEADFRYAAMQLRENAEQVAFYRGGERERQRLSGLFERIRRNTLSIIGRMVKVGLTQGAYGVLTAPVTSQSAGLLALPRYFAGELTLGGLARISTAFGAFCGTLGVFSQMYVTFAAWWAIANRLRALGGRLAAHRDQPGGITLAATGALSLQTSEIQLHTPDGAALNGVPALTLTPGERVMLCGPSGAGKSTLLRALAGLWPHGQGRVLLPTAARTMFLPQKSYIPDGSLRAALAYPAGPDDFAEADLVAALQRCGLGRLAGRLNDVARWQRELSGGEQQRLAMARALLHRPDFIFMDEATSALDEAGEVQLYTALLEQLPRSAVLSVSHHEALIRFHDRRIVLPAPAATA